MTVGTHVLIDAGQAVVADGVVGEKRGMAKGDAGAWQARLRTCHGGRSEGVHVVELDNGAMSIDVLPTRGMGIWCVRRGSKRLGWRAPAQQPVHPAFVPLMEPAGLGWLDGFNELLCRCGLESNGPPEFDGAGRLLRPLHGRIANSPAHYVELQVNEKAGTLALKGIVDEARFHFQSLRLTTILTTTFGSNEFTWTDEVENIGGRTAKLQMLYHFNLGQPLLRPGARISAPIITVAPLTQVAAREGINSWNVVPPPRAGSEEQVYVAELAANDAGDTRALVTGLADNEAIGLRFNKRSLPCFTVWRNTPAAEDGYVLGLEPGTNFPNARMFEEDQGRVKSLRPGEKWRAAVTCTWHSDADAIAEEESKIKGIQTRRTLELLRKPRPEWSPHA